MGSRLSKQVNEIPPVPSTAAAASDPRKRKMSTSEEKDENGNLHSCFCKKRRIEGIKDIELKDKENQVNMDENERTSKCGKYSQSHSGLSEPSVWDRLGPATTRPAIRSEDKETQVNLDDGMNFTVQEGFTQVYTDGACYHGGKPSDQWILNQ